MKNWFIVILLAMVLVSGSFVFAPAADGNAGVAADPGRGLECNDYYWFDDTNTECGLKEFCGAYMYQSLQTFETQEECRAALNPVPEPTTNPEPECKRYYWFDDTSTACGLREFCGAFMYQGLRTFTSKEDCETALRERDCKKLYWFDDTQLSCGYKQFCGAYMYQGLQTFETYMECDKALSLLTEKCCPPKCLHIGTRSEGWYDSCTGERIKWDFCSTCRAVCLKKGTRSEGWYRYCGREAPVADFDHLIKWDCGGCEENYTVDLPETGGTDSGGYGGVTSTGTGPVSQPGVVADANAIEVGVCSSEQPEECTDEDAPVCATIVSFNPNGEYKKYKKTFGNACKACVSSTRTNHVRQYVDGKCEQDTGAVCPAIWAPKPKNCSGKIVPIYKEYSGVKCLVGYKCEGVEKPVENLPVFIYTLSNASARNEKVFKLYKNGLMTETITYHGNTATGTSSIKKLSGEISYVEAKEFLIKLYSLGFFELDLGQASCCVEDPSGLTQCISGAGIHKIYARYIEENKVAWCLLSDTPEAINFALEQVKYFESLMEGTGEHYVKLGEAFDLRLNQSALVRETGLKVRLERIEAGTAVLSVSPPYIGGVTEEAVEVTGELQANTASANATTASSAGGSAGMPAVKHLWVKVKVGETGKAYGHVITLNGVLFPKCSVETTDAGEAVTKCVGAKPFANLTITKPTTDDGIKAYLGEKFKIKQGQHATIFSTAAIQPAKKVMHFSLEGILLQVDCPIEECKQDPETGVEVCPKIYCDTRPLAKVLWSAPSTGGNEMMAMHTLAIREGEVKVQGGFKFHFADLVNNAAVFVVSRAGVDIPYQKVELGEGFKLGVSETALIVEKDIFITLMKVRQGPMELQEEGAPTAEEPPEACTADAKVCEDGTAVGRDPSNNCEFYPCPGEAGYVLVSVWKKGWGVAPVPATSEAIQRIEKIKENARKIMGTATVQKSMIAQTPGQLVPYKKTYTLRRGQSLKVYDIKLTLNGIGEKSAKFVANDLGYGNTINVHVGEPFKLKEDMAARVLGANMRIDLFGISSLTECMDGIDAECNEHRFVKIGVSHLLFKESQIGQAVSSSAISENVKAEIVQEAGIVSSTDIEEIELPPTPFRVFTLGEGESASVGNFEIRVLSIWPEHAEFVVKNKSTGLKFKLVIGKNWNLFSLPGEIRTVSSNECQSSDFRLFEYNPAGKAFTPVLKPEFAKTYWLYNPGGECVADAELVEAVSIYELEDLYEGWNFVPILRDMIGKKIGGMGDCELKGAFFFSGGVWEKALDTEIGREHLGKGLAVYAAGKCSLISAGIPVPDIPELPELPEVE